MQDILNEDRRLAILRVLEGDTDYTVNESVMKTAPDALAHGVSRDQVRGDFALLAEQGLVTVGVVAGFGNVEQGPGRGVEVATGGKTHQGVKSPGGAEEEGE